jgi:hypothetical protein
VALAITRHAGERLAGRPDGARYEFTPAALDA